MRIYIDTNVFLYAIFADPSLGVSCKKILKAVEERLFECVISPLVPTEILAVAVRKRPETAETILDAIFSLPLIVYPIDRTVLSEAVRIAAKYSLTGYDSVHLATAKLASATRFITNDRAIQGVKEVQIIAPMKFSL